jgi:hypothetical protein
MGPSTSSSPPTTPSAGSTFGHHEQTQKAIDAMQKKEPIGDIDFTIHAMEDGTEVSTVERVCKGIESFSFFTFMSRTDIQN